MTTAPHRWRDVIVAWANGETVQYRSLNGSADYWIDETSPDWDDDAWEWRIKPKPQTLTYRVALMKCAKEHLAVVANDVDEEEAFSCDRDWVRWLTDRITVEV